MHTNHFQNIGYITHKFTDDELKPITDEIYKIQSDFSKATPWNYELAGAIKHEYKLEECKSYTESLILPIMIEFDKQFNYFNSIKMMTEDRPVILDNIWVNFQKKYEYNPPHVHDGILSFVIWIKMPFNIEEERSILSANYSNSVSRNACFEFLYTNSLGHVMNTSLPIDKTCENIICVFPSSLTHSVNPFYTSDDYRISVSGNLKIRV